VYECGVMGIIKRLVFIGSVSALGFACGGGSPTPTPVSQATATGAAISGSVQAGSGCSGGAVNVLVYSGSSVVQQQSIQVGANFSFQVSPGAYTVGAQTTSGCGAQQQVSMAQGQTGSVTLTLAQGGQYIPTGTAGYPNTGYPYPYPSTVPGYPNTGYPAGYPQGYPNTGAYPYNPYNPYIPQIPSWAPNVSYPYVYMNGLGGMGYYYWNYGNYTGPCTYGQLGGWICRSDTF
jgi:hypothetical protein